MERKPDSRPAGQATGNRARLAEALRANLAKRKAQARAREAERPAAPAGGKAEPPGG